MIKHIFVFQLLLYSVSGDLPCTINMNRPDIKNESMSTYFRYFRDIYLLNTDINKNVYVLGSSEIGISDLNTNSIFFLVDSESNVSSVNQFWEKV